MSETKNEAKTETTAEVKAEATAETKTEETKIEETKIEEKKGSAALAWLKEMNLPNRLTLLRIALVPVYLVLLWVAKEHVLATVALLVFMAASLTDLLDGRIARSRNLVTNFGKFMDPIADKLLTHTAFIMLCAMGRLNVAACIVFIAREFVVSGLRLVAVEQGRVIAAGMSGKIKTVLQMGLAMLLTVSTDPTPAFRRLTDALTVAAVVMTLWSMIEYVWRNRAVLGGEK